MPRKNLNQCDCGNPAVAIKNNGPVCARCLKIEEMLAEEGRKTAINKTHSRI